MKTDDMIRDLALKVLLEKQEAPLDFEEIASNDFNPGKIVPHQERAPAG